MDPDVDSDDGNWPEFPSSIVRTEGCLLGREEVQLPESLIEQTHIFQEVLSQETWDNCLTSSQKQHLLKFLPKFQQKDHEEKEDTVKQLFEGGNFKFGNPLSQFQNKLRDGYYSPDIARYTSLCKQYKYREYRYRQQRYYSTLLKELIVTRQQLLEEVGHMPPDLPIKMQYSAPLPPKDLNLDHKVTKKYIRLLKEVREECGVEDTTSEEDEEAITPVQKSRRQLFKSLGPIPSPEPTIPGVLATFAVKPLTVNGDVTDDESGAARQLRPISPVEVTEDDFRLMLKTHRKRKTLTEDFPELDTQNITLQDILTRCQANKKSIMVGKSSPSSASVPDVVDTPLVIKKKVKAKDREDKKVKRKIKTEPMDTTVMEDRVASPALPTVPADIREDVVVPDFPLLDTGPSKLDSFFSLLRDIICDLPDQKITTVKLEERIKEWHESPSSSLNTWFSWQPSWVTCVISALKFLSGDVLGLSVENFIPYLDYKERAQQWKWIGAGRDADTELSPLCQHWLKHKDTVTTDGAESTQSSPPPPRAKTTFVVRPTTHKEKATFQEQEKRRFEKPHKAFIYHMHGYDSVVGPVKGVYSKDNSMNKAREHALLVSDRPAFVTILTLVRDAAARLPNGEGTRGDICELLKDSQFLAPGVTDTQINTVVSGALDRLHSEKDPCVKYDVNRKLWIYLHRNRTEEEFERIHQAQGAAVKAKKSLQKPKTAKTIKDAISAQAVPRASLHVNATADVDLSTIQTQGLANTALLQGPKTFGQTSFCRPPLSSPKQHTPSTKQAAVNQNILTSPPAHKNSGNILQSPGLTQGAISKQVAPQFISTSSLLASTVSPSAIPVTKQEVGAARKAQSINLLQQQQQQATFIRQQGVPQNITMTAKGEMILQRPAGLVAQQPSSPGQIPNMAKLICLASVTTGVTTVSNVASSNVSTDSQTVARLIQQVSGQQMVTVNNLLAGGVTTSQRVHHGATPRTTTIKIQGGSIMQPVGGGKPIHIGGKPLAHAKGLMQISGKNQQSLGVIQTAQGTLSAISIIPQTLSTSMVTLSQAKHSSVQSAISGAILSEVSTSSTALNQVSAGGRPRMSVVTPASVTQSIHLGGQPRIVSPSQAGIVVTHLAPGIALRPGLAGVSGAKMISASQAGLAQLIMQQAPGGLKTMSGETLGVMTNVSQGVAGTPFIVSNAGGKVGQNIQVVRTMLSQQASGLKAGQATILISQPTLQQAQAQVMHTAVGKSGRGSPKGKAQPVYARIITPPPGIKLTTMGQPGINVLQTAMGKLLNNVPISTTVSLPSAAIASIVDGSTESIPVKSAEKDK